MNSKFVIFYLLFVIKTGFTQTSFLSGINFNDDGYTLTAWRYSESDRSSLADSLDDFYIEDTTLLNSIQQSWKFSTPGKYYDYSFNYSVRLFKGKELIKVARIHLPEQQIAIGESRYYFDPQLMRNLCGKTKFLYHYNISNETLEESRKAYQKELNDSLLVDISQVQWMQFDGEFDLQYTFKKKKETEIDLREWEKYFEKYIHERWPEEKCSINWNMGSLKEIGVRITANKSLYDKILAAQSDFKIEEWQPFKQCFFSVSKKMHERRSRH